MTRDYNNIIYTKYCTIAELTMQQSIIKHTQATQMFYCSARASCAGREVGILVVIPVVLITFHKRGG